MNKKTIATYVLLMIALTGFSKVWKLSDANLKVKFDDQTTLISVSDKRCNKVWEQLPFDKNFMPASVVQNKNVLEIKFSGTNKYIVNIELTSTSGLTYSISGESGKEMSEFQFPSSFKTPDKNYYLLETDGEGLLLPVDDTGYPMGKERTYFCGGGVAMAWMGITDSKFQTGYMAILETPYDASLQTKRENGLITFSPVWLPSMEKFGYSRKVTYHFFDKGGYVAQAKKYREFIWQKNNVISLKEKQKQFPAIEKMIGAVQIYVWDKAREVSFAKELKQAGIEKAFIFWDPNHDPYPVPSYDNKLKELGYLSGSYELFTEMEMRDTIYYEQNDLLTLERTRFPGKFNELVARKKDGSTIPNYTSRVACPLAMKPEISKRIDREIIDYPHEAYFMDVYQANGLFECYSKEHPLTRQQYAEEVIKNAQLISEKYKTLIGGEWGADFMGSSSIFNQGMMTLQRTWWGSGIENKGTIYHTGNWDNNPRPSAMLGSRTANETYLKYSINEYTRVPLYELVYHDAVVSTWRWDDASHHAPEIWWKKDLFNILYGTAPLWSIDQDRWEAYKNTFIENYKNVCPWLQQIGYDELVSHRFVTEDHKVQESVFSSGKKVLVNFGNVNYNYQGENIEPKGFIILN